jgi:hypothetical protein
VVLESNEPLQLHHPVGVAQGMVYWWAITSPIDTVVATTIVDVVRSFRVCNVVGVHQWIG